MRIRSTVVRSMHPLSLRVLAAAVGCLLTVGGCGSGVEPKPVGGLGVGALQRVCAPYDGAAFSLEVAARDGRTIRALVTDPLPGEAGSFPVRSSWVVGTTSKPHAFAGSVCDAGGKTGCKDVASGSLELTAAGEGRFKGRLDIRLDGGEHIKGWFESGVDVLNERLCG